MLVSRVLPGTEFSSQRGKKIVYPSNTTTRDGNCHRRQNDMAMPHLKRFSFNRNKATGEHGTYSNNMLRSVVNAILKPKPEKTPSHLLSQSEVGYLRRNMGQLRAGDMVLVGSTNAIETWTEHNGSLTRMTPGQTYDLEATDESGRVIHFDAEFVGFAPDFAGGETKFVAAEGAA